MVTEEAEGEVDVLLSFGKSPGDMDAKEKGLGVYSVPFCLKKAEMADVWVDG